MFARHRRRRHKASQPASPTAYPTLPGRVAFPSTIAASWPALAASTGATQPPIYTSSTPTWQKYRTGALGPCHLSPRGGTPSSATRGPVWEGQPAENYYAVGFWRRTCRPSLPGHVLAANTLRGDADGSSSRYSTTSAHTLDRHSFRVCMHWCRSCGTDRLVLTTFLCWPCFHKMHLVPSRVVQMVAAACQRDWSGYPPKRRHSSKNISNPSLH